MRLYTIDELKAIIAPVAEKYRIPAVYLFGAYARGDATAESDVDLLIDTTGTELRSLITLGAVLCDLEDALEKKVDLITLHSLKQPAQMPSDLSFRENVDRERVTLYVAA